MKKIKIILSWSCAIPFIIFLTPVFHIFGFYYQRFIEFSEFLKNMEDYE